MPLIAHIGSIITIGTAILLRRPGTTQMRLRNIARNAFFAIFSGVDITPNDIAIFLILLFNGRIPVFIAPGHIVVTPTP